MSSVNIIVHRNPCLTSSVGLSYTNADKKGLRPICNPYNTCNTCPAPPSHTSLSLLTSSCSTTVPLLEPYYIISIDLKKKKTRCNSWLSLYIYSPPPFNEAAHPSWLLLLQYTLGLAFLSPGLLHTQYIYLMSLYSVSHFTSHCPQIYSS